MPPDRRSLWSRRSSSSGDHEWLEPGVAAAPDEPDAGERTEPAAAASPDAGGDPGGGVPPGARGDDDPGSPGSDRPPRRDRRRLLVPVLAAIAILAVGVAVGEALGGGDRSVRTVESPPVTGKSGGTSRLSAVYASAQDGVVQIRAGRDAGTGFVYDAEGTVVTNAHVVSGASSVRVAFGDSTATIAGRVLGTDPSSDLAAVHVNPDDVDRLAPLRLGNSDRVRTGEEVMAIGYPLGLERTATAGIVSGIGRHISATNGFSIDKVIQTDAPINPGNSGGPLLDTAGAVIGVNSQIATSGGGSGNIGIGFSIPANEVRDVIPRLERGQTIRRPYLGVRVADLSGDRGAAIADVVAGGPADRAGLDAGRVSTTGSVHGGDVIVAVAGTKVGSGTDVTNALSRHKPGETIALTVRHDGRRRTVSVRLGTRPASAARSGRSSGGGSGGSGGRGGPVPSPPKAP